jgi:hypothetical protein
MLPTKYLSHIRSASCYGGLRTLVLLIQWGTFGIILFTVILTFSLSWWNLIAAVAVTLARVICILLFDLADLALLKLSLEEGAGKE